jgi:biopolymer transport protein ExbD/biopolymer transport protein TolR
MRRFSQRNSLVTLSDINITPMLDLAFVLLIIFIITTPLIDPGFEQSIDIKLAQGGRDSGKVERDILRVVEIDRTGGYKYDRKPISLENLESALARTHRTNPKIVVVIRCDEKAPAGTFYPVFDWCVQNGVSVNLKTQPTRRQ